LDGKVGEIIIDVPDEDEGSTFDTNVHFVPSGSDEPSESFHLNNIVELKKGGVGLPRSVLGWAAGMDLAGNGLEVRIKDAGGKQGDLEQEGRVVQFERVGRRDALFVRLVSLSEALWETL
jgi:hypothetical protein